MLTTSPILTGDAKNASPRAFQFASSRSSLHGSPGRQRSRSRKNSVASQSPTVVPSSTPGRPTSGPMASPSKLRAENGAQESNLANGSAPAGLARKTVVPVEPSDEPANSQASPEPPRRSESSQNKPNSAKRSATSPARAPPSEQPQSEAADHAALGEPGRRAQRPRTLPAAPKVLPLAYETCAVEDMVILIAHMISELVETNDCLALSSGSLTRFHSRYMVS